MFASLETVCEDNIAFLCGSDLPYGAVAKRLVTCLRQIQEHGQALQPVVGSFTAVFHHYDFDAQTPGNGYRTLVKVRLTPQRSCLSCESSLLSTLFMQKVLLCISLLSSLLVF